MTNSQYAYGMLQLPEGIDVHGQQFRNLLRAVAFGHHGPGGSQALFLASLRQPFLQSLFQPFFPSSLQPFLKALLASFPTVRGHGVVHLVDEIHVVETVVSGSITPSLR